MATGLLEERVETMAMKRHDSPIKIDVNVLAEVRIAAAYEGMSIAEYVSDRMQAAASADIARHVEARRHITPPTETRTGTKRRKS